ncbi:hypothetical protein TI04_04885 [Achromatium sp. WMS2]|nr:hypothetical protein TI04_04885 [Achromatium sp. WMS2]
MRESATWLACCVCLATLFSPIQAFGDNVVCVSTANDLSTALAFAAGNGQADVIKLVRGLYVGNFSYPGPAEAYDLTIQGGYTANCAARVLDPTNTVLDSNNVATVLIVSVGNFVANVTVEGLTIRNGNNTSGNGGGLHISMSNPSSNIVLAHNRLENNASSSNTGGAYVAAGTITATKTTFANNSGGKGQSCAQIICSGHTDHIISKRLDWRKQGS